MSQLAPLALLLIALADPPSSGTDLVAALESALADAVAKVEPSVVAIAREKSDNGEETTAIRGRKPPTPPANAPLPGQFRLELVPQGLDPTLPDLLSFDYGSGVVIGEGGQILTAYHVVKGASRLVVRAAKNQAFEAEIIAADPRSDLAVLVPRVTPGARPPALRPIALGDATRLRKGSFLLALGNPFNSARDGTASASWGILANLARRLEPPEEERHLRQLRHFPTLLQLDSKLNLGMSGGAVVDLKGELVGLTTAAASAAGFDAHAGYAIPIDPMTRRVIDALKQGKEVEYGFIGISLDGKVGAGNKVASIQAGTPADQGGLHEGDTIIAVGETPVTDGDSLILAVNAAPVGRPVKLRILRDGKTQERTLILSKMPVHGEVIATNRAVPWRGLRVDFTSTIVTGTVSQSVLEAMAKGNVGIAEVLPGSPAEAAGLKRGQVITAVDNQPVRTLNEFAKAVADRKGPVTLTTDLGTVIVK